MEIALTSPARGRPRSFCVDEALYAALDVFWAKGYDNASLTDLTEAMGINGPSLYSAFGNKEALFHKALKLYESEKLEYVRAALGQPTARRVAEHFLRGAIDAHAAEGRPHGCLNVMCSLSLDPGAGSIHALLSECRAATQSALVARLERAKGEGDLPAHLDAEGLMHFLNAVRQGLIVEAGAGASRTDLEKLVETSLALWPSP
jgi:AcrR family transcriptional regulator